MNPEEPADGAKPREAAEKRLRRLVDRRNELNEEAKIAREERDHVNEERRRILDELRSLLEKRRSVNEELQVHKRRRNELQARAKGLIELKKAKREGASTLGMSRVRELEAEITLLEHRQQTQALSLKKENALLDLLKLRRKELGASQQRAHGEERLLGDIQDLDGEITRLFQAADQEHGEVVRLHGDAELVQRELEPHQKELDHLKGQADKKHAEYVELRERADHYHARASEMRGTVITLRDEEESLYREGQQAMDGLRKQVEAALADETKLDENAAEAVELLKRRRHMEL